MAPRLWLLALGCVLALGGASAQPPANSSAYPAGYLFIDCGSSTEVPLFQNGTFTVNGTGVGGAAVATKYLVAPLNSSSVHSITNATLALALNASDVTLRAFSGNTSDQGCYVVNAAPGNWSVRLGFAYYNYDNRSTFPNFTVSVQGMLVDQVALADWESPEFWDPVGTSPWGGVPGAAHRTEYMVAVNSGPLSVCFRSVDGSSPIVNSLELVPLSGMAAVPEMFIFTPEVNWTLSLKHRYYVGGPSFGPSIEDDPLVRRWESPGEDAYIFIRVKAQPDLQMPSYSLLNSTAPANATVPVDGYPRELFKHALQGGKLQYTLQPNAQFLGIRFHYWPFDPASHFLMRLFFAELDPQATRGQRTFNVTFAAFVLGDYLWEDFWMPFEEQNTDILQWTNGTANKGLMLPFYGCHPEPALFRQNQSLFLFLSSDSSALPPVLSGVEFYEVVAPSYGKCPPPSLQPFFNSSITDPTPFTDSSDDAPALSGGAIVGIVAAAVVGGVLLLAGVIFLIKLRAHRRSTSFQRFQAEGPVG